jgi:spore maturation protein CgeB
MSYLILGPDSPEVDINDVQYALSFAKYAGAPVHRLDPEVVYAQYGMDGLQRVVKELIQRERVRALIYLLGTDFDFYPEFFGQLRDVYRVLLLGDDEHYFDVSHRYYAQHFDLVLTTNPLYDRFKLLGVDAMFFPVTYDDTVFNPGARPSKEIDVSFIGMMHDKAGRREYAAALEHAGLHVSLFGAGTAAGVISRDRVVEIYRRSRINLNFAGANISTPLNRNFSINQRVRQIKARCTKIALCGSFLLTEYAPGTERLFAIGEEIDVFHSPDDLVDKVKLYLGNEERREAMAAKALQRAQREYVEAKYWPALAQTIARLAEERKRHRRVQTPAFFDIAFWSAFGAARFKYLVIFAFGLQLGPLFREMSLLVRTFRFNLRASLWYMAAGLHVARRKSRLADRAAVAAHKFRRLLRPW